MNQAASFSVLLPRSMCTFKQWEQFNGLKTFTSRSAFDSYLSNLERHGFAVDRTNPLCAVVASKLLTSTPQKAQQGPKSAVLVQSGIGLMEVPANLRSSPAAARIVNLAIYLRRLDLHPVQFKDELHKKNVIRDLQRLACDYITSATLDHEAESARSRARAAGRAQRAPQARSEARPAGPGGLTC